MLKNKSNIILKIIFGVVITTGLGFFLNSIIKDWDVEQDLGSNYILCADGDIIYQRDKTAEYVIPFGTARYGFDERWIVVETITRSAFHQTLAQDTITGEVHNYWIIDKSIPVDIDNPSTFKNIYYQANTYSIVRKGLTGPLDSIDFEKEIWKRRIKLIWHKKK